MKRLIPIFAMLFAFSAAGYFIYLAQSNAPSFPPIGPAPGFVAPVPSGRASPPSLRIGPQKPVLATDTPAAAAVSADTANTAQKKDDTQNKKKVFLGGSKAYGPIGGEAFLGGSKAIVLSPEDSGLGRLRGAATGSQDGTGAVDVRGTVAVPRAPSSNAPGSANSKVPVPTPEPAPTPALNAPPSFMGGSKFDPGSIPLPKRPKSGP